MSAQMNLISMAQFNDKLLGYTTYVSGNHVATDPLLESPMEYEHQVGKHDPSSPISRLCLTTQN